MSRVAAVWLIFLIAALDLTTTRSADAASNGNWSVYPTTLLGQKPQVVFSPHLFAGHTTADSVTVTNLSTSLLTFNLYAADAFNTPGGGLSLRREVDPVEGVGAWIHLAHSAITVAAHASVAIPFVIVVPRDATPGDHVGGIVAEETTGSPSSLGSVPITVVQAVGVRFYGLVSGPLVARLKVLPPTIEVHRTVGSLFGAVTSARVTLMVTNVGNVVVTPVATLRVTSLLASPVKRTIVVGQLLPGSSLTRSETITGLRSVGPVEARVSVSASGTRASATASQWDPPWGLVAAITVVVLAMVVVWGMRRRRRRRRQRHRRNRRRRDMSQEDRAGAGRAKPAHASHRREEGPAGGVASTHERDANLA